MGGLASQEVRRFLEKLGEEYESPARLYLIGGSALCLLGSPRRTMDLDFSLAVSETTKKLRNAMAAVADQLHVELEVITIEEFVPVPANASLRHKFVGQFGQIDVYVFDPYTLALSKLARGLETDIQDILFMLNHDLLESRQLMAFVEEATSVAWEYDIDPADLRHYMGEVRRLNNADNE